MQPGPLKLDDLDRAYVAVVQLATQMPGVIHQVTLRPDKVHGNLIRLGETTGDEVTGWLHSESIQILAILGEAHEKDGKWECRPIKDLALVSNG